MIDPAARIPVTLEARQWEIALGALGGPVVQVWLEIHRQCLAHDQPTAPPRTNGDGRLDPVVLAQGDIAA